MLIAFFTIVYFRVFLFLLNLIFRNTLSAFGNLMAVICCIIAFIVSIELADYTVKKIEDKYSKK